MTFDEAGRLKTIASTEEFCYRISYDRFGKATEFKLDETTVLSKEYGYEENEVTVNYHRSGDEIDSIKTEYDNYGRVKRVLSNGERALELTYQDETGECTESPTVANIKTMEDFCAGLTYTYFYDGLTGQPTEYQVKNKVNGKKYSVKCTGVNEYTYEFEGLALDFKDEIKYDEECLLSPRIKSLSNKHIAGVTWEFDYDALGRISEKKAKSIFTEIHYKTGTALKDSIKYSEELTDSGGNTQYYLLNTIAQSYDKRGNVKSITYSKASDTYVNSYEYDGANRLVEERYKENGVTRYAREYSYDTAGNICQVKEGGTTEEYRYEKGRLKSVYENRVKAEEYSYDDYGNPLCFKSATQNMWWERGTLLKQYVKNGSTLSYTYDAQGHMVKKNGTELYYDGDKLLAQNINDDKKLRFIYDVEGIAGFKLGILGSDIYLYQKDGQGNVVGLMKNGTVVARYLYDAWGNCKIVDAQGDEITAWDNAAVLNPIRWKSQFYDVDSGLYWIGNRWYDPERGRYISAASPEMLLTNAGVVYAVNLYAFCISNPLAVIIAAKTVLPTLELYFNGEMPWWDRWGKLIILAIVGIVATIVACAVSGPCGGAATAATISATIGEIVTATLIGAAVSLAIGGTIAGIQSALTGHGFWEGFAESVQEEAVDALITSFAFTAITIAASNIMKCFQCFKEGTLVETEEGLKPIEEIEVGDKVLAYDEETGEQAYKPVLQLFRNESKDWIKVTVEGTEIESTTGHKYYLPETKKWVAAAELKVGTKVLLFDGSYGIIEAVKSVHYDKPQTTYNFEVADFHTYYVGTGVLVHNKGTCYYRGSDRGAGNERIFEPRDKDLEIEDGIVTQDGGVSVNTDPNHYTVTQHRHIYEFTVSDLPEGIKVLPDPSIDNPGHCILIPDDGYKFTKEQFIELLKQIKSRKVR